MEADLTAATCLRRIIDRLRIEAMEQTKELPIEGLRINLTGSLDDLRLGRPERLNQTWETAVRIDDDTHMLGVHLPGDPCLGHERCDAMVIRPPHEPTQHAAADIRPGGEPGPSRSETLGRPVTTRGHVGAEQARESLNSAHDANPLKETNRRTRLGPGPVDDELLGLGQGITHS